MVKVELRAVGAQLVGAVEHQHVLDDKAVGLTGVDVLAHLSGPGGGPVHQLQVLVGAARHLAPAGLVEAEEDVAVLVLVGGLDGGGVAGDDGVVVNGDGEAGVSGLVDEPSGALGGVGVGVDADGVAGVVLVPAVGGGGIGGLGRLGGGGISGSGVGGLLSIAGGLVGLLITGGLLGIAGGVVLAAAAGQQGANHRQGEEQCNESFLHFFFLLKISSRFS